MRHPRRNSDGTGKRRIFFPGYFLLFVFFIGFILVSFGNLLVSAGAKYWFRLDDTSTFVEEQ